MVLFVAVASAQTPAIRSELGVINAAGFGKTDKVAAGSLFSIYGTNLSGTLAQTDSTTLSTSMADVDSVTFTSGTTVVKAPLRFVFGTQINAQVPWGLPPGTVNVVVTRSGVSSAPYTATIAAFSPTVYDFNPLTQAIAVNSDGSITAAAGIVPGVAAHPAKAGDTIFFYASGLGNLDKAPPADGFNSNDTLRKTANELTVKLGGVPVKVDFAGLSPQFTGVYQVNIQIPGGFGVNNAIPMELTIGGVNSVDPATIAVM
jgi:uncharacterized protein (TIGR03437 family)